MKKLNSILLIDDDMATNFISKMLIKKAAITDNIVFAFNGRQGLDYLTNSGEYQSEDRTFPVPMLILLDINMPLMSGFEVLDEINKKGIKMKIIAQTAFAMPEERQKCLNSGCQGYVSKPIRKDDLFKEINNVLAL